MKEICESGMVFGEFPEEDLFHIEESQLYLSVGIGVKTVEFILLKEDEKIMLVEARTSCPNAANKDGSEEKATKFEEYYSDITDKFIDSLQMLLSVALHRNPHLDGIGSRLKERDIYEKADICFVLVIKSAVDEEWLAGPKAELEARLRRMVKIWRANVIVLNESLAVEYGLAVK